MLLSLLLLAGCDQGSVGKYEGTEGSSEAETAGGQGSVSSNASDSAPASGTSASTTGGGQVGSDSTGADLTMGETIRVNENETEMVRV